MIFSASCKSPLLAASHASSASLRARRRSFSLTFLGFMTLPRGGDADEQDRSTPPLWIAMVGTSTEFIGPRKRWLCRMGSEERVLTQKDLVENSHWWDCRRLLAPSQGRA